MKYLRKITLKLILKLTKHIWFAAIIALIPFSSSSQCCDPSSQDCNLSWVLLSTSTGSCDGSSIQKKLDLQYPDSSTSCRSDWGLAQFFDQNYSDIKYVFITPGDYRWLGTLQMRGFADETKHIVYISDTDGDGYCDEIDNYINSGELVTPMDDISDPDSIVPEPLTHAIIENMRLYRDGTGAGNFIIKGLSFSGIFGGIEDIVTDGGDYSQEVFDGVIDAGFDLQNYNWTNLHSNVHNNILNDDVLSSYLGADQCGFTSGLRNEITGTNVTLDRILIENVRRGNALRVNTCHNCVISNSIIRNSYDEFCTLYNEVFNLENLVNAGSDNIGIAVLCSETSCEDISILSNKIYNTSDGIQFIYQPPSGLIGNFPNGLVQNNDIYFKPTSYIYLDDENKVQQGTADGELQMIQGEDGFDIKIGGTAISPLVIRDNNIFGWRRAFGTGGDGFAINCHINASNVTIEANHIYDCQNGIGLGNQNADNNSLSDNFNVTNNVIENLYLGIDHCDPGQINEFKEDDTNTPNTDERRKPTGLGISSSVHKGVHISGNCISETIIPLQLQAWTGSLKPTNEDDNHYGGNMFVTGNTCKNNTKPMFFMRSILLNNPDAFSNFTNNVYEYYEDETSQIFECCGNLSSVSNISNYATATVANSFIPTEVISSTIDPDNLCEMNTEVNNISCFGDCDLGDYTNVTFNKGKISRTGLADITANVNPVGVYTYVWDDGTTGPEKEDACLGKDHSVTITNTLGCSETYTFEGELKPSIGTIGGPILQGQYPCAFTFTPLGGNKLGNDINNIEVWPNPANINVNVKISSFEYNKAEVKLYSLLGSEVLTKIVNSKTDAIDLDVSDVENGVYLLKVITDGQEIHTQKLTIAH